jgi:hypothetical protein
VTTAGSRSRATSPTTPGGSPGDVDVAQRLAGRVVELPHLGWDDVHVEFAEQGAKSSLVALEEPVSDRRCGRAADGHRQWAWSVGVREDGGLATAERLDQPLEDRRDERRHVATDDEHALDPWIERAQPRGDPTQRTLVRAIVVGHRHIRWDARPGVRRNDDHDVGDHRAKAIDDVVEHRPTCDGLDELVAPEPRRPAAGKDDRGHPFGHPSPSLIGWRRSGPSAPARGHRAFA